MVEEAPVVSETVVVRRPVIVEPPPLVVEEYPVYPAPRVYAARPLCMPTPAQFGVVDGAIAATSTAVGELDHTS